MKISELSPDSRRGGSRSPSAPAASPPIEELEAAISAAEFLSPSDPSASAVAARLRAAISRLASIPSPLPDPTRLHLWKLSYRLWNACVDLSNASPAATPSPCLADLRLAAADILLLAGAPPGVPSPELKSASFFLKTGLAYHDLRRLDLAAKCFERATDLISTVPIHGEEERNLLLEVNLARSRTAWEDSDRNLAIALLNRSKNLAATSPAAFKALAEQYLQCAKLDLSNRSQEGVGPISDASKLLSEALDLCEKGILEAKGRASGEKLALESLRERCLKFIAAERLGAGDYEGVLRCVRVLRDGNPSAGEHASVGYVAMRAWLGMGRVEEAEKELRAMMATMGVATEGVVLAAAELFVGVAGAEEGKRVVEGLVGRCQTGAATALRLVRRVAEGGNGTAAAATRVSVVAELAGDDKVVAAFEVPAAAKERAAMHALLWNFGADHFRLKDYHTSAEMFEKSMLYVPNDEENRARRSNCFRVLSLCHLGLAQLDRAQEFIDEAEKLEPNIKCAFLKFKIYLQKKDEKQAITQMQTMVSCNDFNPEFLTLSTHEAIACQSFPVAVSSLALLLNLYSPGKPMPMSEVATLRNLITLLHRSSDTDHEILKYTKHARMRMTELGADNFFGKGAVRSRELNWFAGTSWNMGLKTGKNKRFDFCAEFMELAAEFYSTSFDGNEGNPAMVWKSLILSVGAMISVEEQLKITLASSDIKKAIEMLNRAGKILSTLPPSIDQAGEESTLIFLHTFNTYQLLNRLDVNDIRSQQLQLIKNFASLKACLPEHLLHLGLAASQGALPNLDAAEFSLNACLSAALALPSPDYRIISIAIRKLAGLGQVHGNDAAYSIYKQAYQIIVGLKEGEYPVEEGKWLAMTAWNKSGMAVRLRQVDTARRWMKMGLDLSRHLPGMNIYTREMEQCFENFEKLCGGSNSFTSEAEETGTRSIS
ncbi:Meiosis specific protein Spo22/ZIP4/TEX11 protein [Dioscorea alata]|uniref:Meiosis specific protein Spo22/ZIP4/TEX11 protein n=1 Tax=Dioscorea alata TaxID=55571 RepID=A0ACB7WAK0_DIOAL|nr:Meiosis specific protein Spo22/ZIP4/TEX11 protein [Dioscorea alata]